MNSLLEHIDCYLDRFSPWAYSLEENLTRIEQKAKFIQQNADVFVIVGVGGSNNAARAIIEAMPKGKVEIVYAGTSTSPWAMDDVLKRIKGKSVYIDVIAKNFETLEPGASFRVLRKYLTETYGSEAHSRITVTGTKGSRLEKLAKENEWDFFTFPDSVGGRYSMFTDVALLPIAVAGLNIRKYLDSARKTVTNIKETKEENNEAFKYAKSRFQFFQQGYKAEVLSSFEPRLSYFFKWWVQLFGESEGKNNKGLIPITCSFSEELHSMGQFLQDGTQALFETFLITEEDVDGLDLCPDKIEDGFSYLDDKKFVELNKAALSSAMEAHSAHIPQLVLKFGKVDEALFGQLYAFFAVSCILCCEMNKVNPFEQEGVESYKKSMFKILGRD